jgi:hypothetical protein
MDNLMILQSLDLFDDYVKNIASITTGNER